jgi:hypothetical protein
MEAAVDGIELDSLTDVSPSSFIRTLNIAVQALKKRASRTAFSI